jgi:hypothetical protein
MSTEVLFEKDMLYPTDNSIEPGCIHIRILSPDNRSRLPVLIQAKSNHSPIKYIDSIVRLMQTDIFDRILVDIRKNVELYILNDQSDADSGSNTCIKVYYKDGELVEEEAEFQVQGPTPR